MDPSFGNLLRPFLLARLSLSVVAVVACAVGLGVAFTYRRAESEPLGSLRRIRAERSAELASALVQTSFFATALATLVTIVGAERAHHEIRGAMCAYGVLASTEHGMPTLLAGTLASVACAAWLALHRLDMRLSVPSLTRTKLVALGAVFPAVAYDLATSTRFALELDFGVVATCCTSTLDRADTVLGSSGGPGATFPLAVLAGALAIGASFALVRRASRARAVGTSLALALFGALGTLATTDVVAPHVFGVPGHRCPFCLFSAEGHALGYPLLGSLFVALCFAGALASLELERRTSPADVDSLERSLGRMTALASAVAFVSMVAPVIAYRLSTGAFVVTPW